MTEQEMIDAMPLISTNELADFLGYLSIIAMRHEDDDYYVQQWLDFMEYQDAEIEAQNAVKH